MSCPEDFALVDVELGRLINQYREAPNLQFLMRTYLRQVEIIIQEACALPSFFDIDTAVGDQLTLIGKRMGWPRCHCVCTVQPVFGFECDGVSAYPITDFCDENGTWIDCDPFGVSEICINDDALYRKFLKVRAYQIEKRFDRAGLTEAIRIFWGSDAFILDDRGRQVVIAPARELTQAEQNIRQLYPRVLPVAPGIGVRFHFGTVFPVAGIGEGWGGLDEARTDSPVLADENGNVIADENGNLIALTGGADWMCPVDVHPYDCA